MDMIKINDVSEVEDFSDLEEIKKNPLGKGYFLVYSDGKETHISAQISVIKRIEKLIRLNKEEFLGTIDDAQLSSGVTPDAQNVLSVTESPSSDEISDVKSGEMPAPKSFQDELESITRRLNINVFDLVHFKNSLLTGFWQSCLNKKELAEKKSLGWEYARGEDLTPESAKALLNNKRPGETRMLRGGVVELNGHVLLKIDKRKAEHIDRIYRENDQGFKMLQAFKRGTGMEIVRSNTGFDIDSIEKVSVPIINT